MSEQMWGNTYDFDKKIGKGILNNHRFHELKFMPVYEYEIELGLSMSDKAKMLDKVISFLERKNIQVTFTDRIIDDIKPWERVGDNEWRYLPIAELQGSNICVNPRNIDFLSVFMSIGHIYGHLVQRMDFEKYKPITDLLEMPKPMDLEKLFEDYRTKHGREYKADFLAFEQEAFSYAKFTFIEAGIDWTDTLEYAMNVYIEADFNELWKWVIESPNKEGSSFMAEFKRLWDIRRGSYSELNSKPIDIQVIPDPFGQLIVVRNDKDYSVC